MGGMESMGPPPGGTMLAQPLANTRHIALKIKVISSKKSGFLSIMSANLIEINQSALAVSATGKELFI
jgi:hypothetical protein